MNVDPHEIANRFQVVMRKLPKDLQQEFAEAARELLARLDWIKAAEMVSVANQVQTALNASPEIDEDWPGLRFRLAAALVAVESDERGSPYKVVQAVGSHIPVIDVPHGDYYIGRIALRRGGKLYQIQLPPLPLEG